MSSLHFFFYFFLARLHEMTICRRWSGVCCFVHRDIFLHHRSHAAKEKKNPTITTAFVSCVSIKGRSNWSKRSCMKKKKTL
ncbi:hypothetical protein BC939DRAFT_434163 [Gamsiella multidivaricata]|uniref:uncharacterized protein n=1 Tax=Gamsiella multidivaricata TaxID=101098 RepID=UPI00221F90B2|nr:uncharacterized protein BC939DRAFT_434163 [Gamsiella multidivaricata]KAI7832728.1 hypothetical protein BC939DRAFT_434163 [Gamsiella multidivaricata]